MKFRITQAGKHECFKGKCIVCGCEFPADDKEISFCSIECKHVLDFFELFEEELALITLTDEGKQNVAFQLVRVAHDIYPEGINVNFGGKV